MYFKTGYSVTLPGCEKLQLYTPRGLTQLHKEQSKRVPECRFKTLRRAETFCSARATCQGVVHLPTSRRDGCLSKGGCYAPRHGAEVTSTKFKKSGGRTYVKTLQAMKKIAPNTIRYKFGMGKKKKGCPKGFADCKGLSYSSSSKPKHPRLTAAQKAANL